MKGPLSGNDAPRQFQFPEPVMGCSARLLVDMLNLLPGCLRIGQALQVLVRKVPNDVSVGRRRLGQSKGIWLVDVLGLPPARMSNVHATAR